MVEDRVADHGNAVHVAKIYERFQLVHLVSKV
jgi:hypothetical protein